MQPAGSSMRYDGALNKLLQVTSAQAEDYSDIPNSQIRRITAKRLLESKQTVPHYYLTIDCRVDKLVKLRQQLNASLAKDGKKLSVNDFVIKASAQVSLGQQQHVHGHHEASFKLNGDDDDDDDHEVVHHLARNQVLHIQILIQLMLCQT